MGKEVQAVMDTANDLNLIRKGITDHLCLQPLFPTRAAKHAAGIPRKIYSVFHEQLQITESFRAHLHA